MLSALSRVWQVEIPLGPAALEHSFAVKPHPGTHASVEATASRIMNLSAERPQVALASFLSAIGGIEFCAA